MSDPIPPLFKYVPPERVDILETERITFTPPLRFNDPFDCHPTFCNLPSFEDLWRDERSTPQFKGTEEERRRLTREMLEELQTDPEFFLSSVQEGTRKQICENGGVLCLTSVKDSLLMWAHYAASHFGFVFEFNRETPVFQSLGTVFHVIYSESRCQIDIRTMPTADVVWLRTKSQEWAYEKEFRIIRKLNECVAEQKDGKALFFRPLPKSAIRAIYLGVSMEKSFRDRISAAVRGTPIKVFQAKLPQKAFGLEFEPVTN